MDPKKQTAKNTRKIRSQNVLEALKDIGSGTIQSFNKDLLGAGSKDFARQLFGMSFEPRKVSGDIMPGESVEIDKAYSGEHQKVIQEKRQLSFLNQLKDDEAHLIHEKGNELRIQLNTLQKELISLVETTADLAEETKIAAMSAPIEPSVYEVNRIEKIILFIKSFRVDASNAYLWMQESNKRSQKKNYWAKYKKHGSKFLLSADHYLTRSAG